MRKFTYPLRGRLSILQQFSPEFRDGRLLLAVALRSDGSIQGSCIQEDQIRSENLTDCVRKVMTREPRQGPDADNVHTLYVPLVLNKPRYSPRYDGPGVCQ